MNAPSKDKRLILLTGGTGFVGYHTVRQLLNQNYSVRCLVRATSNTSRIPPAVESVVGALEDPISLEQAVADCWGVIHLSALVKARDKAEFYRVNRDGTMNLVEAAHQAGVRRFVYCSSQAAGGPSSLHHIRTPDDEPNPVTDYGRSKLAGEKVLTESAKTMWYCILRPPAVYGPLDTSFLTLVKGVNSGFKLRLGKTDRPFAIIHGEDLARALVTCLDVDHPSGATWYVTDGINHTNRELGEIVEHALGKKSIWITIPETLIPTIGSINQLWGKVTGKTPFLTAEKLNEFMQPSWACDDSSFRQATGFKPQIDLQQGMMGTIKWYKENGWL